MQVVGVALPLCKMIDQNQKKFGIEKEVHHKIQNAKYFGMS